MKYLSIIITIIVSAWILFSWGEVVYKQDHHDHEYSDINAFVMLLDIAE